MLEKTKDFIKNIIKDEKACCPKCPNSRSCTSYTENKKYQSCCEECASQDVTCFQNPLYVMSLMHKNRNEKKADSHEKDYEFILDYHKEALQCILAS